MTCHFQNVNRGTLYPFLYNHATNLFLAPLVMSFAVTRYASYNVKRNMHTRLPRTNTASRPDICPCLLERRPNA
jgi:hypothetical protein